MFIVHYAHYDCPVNPLVTWTVENGPEYGACNDECPECGTRDIEPVSYHDEDDASCKRCAAEAA